MRFNEQGRSMIEMLGVLAIVGVLSVGGIAGYSKAMNKFKTNKLIEQVNMISTNVRTLYASQKNYSDLTNGVAIRTGILPNEMVATNASQVTTPSTFLSGGITNAFSGGVFVGPAGVKTDDDAGAFIIAMDKIPEAACVSIATTEWGGDAGGGLLAMSIVTGSTVAADTGLSGSQVTADGTFTIEDGELPISVVNASQECSGAENLIAWKYM
jgi:type II secretory pathway pseudopilin PulG